MHDTPFPATPALCDEMISELEAMRSEYASVCAESDQLDRQRDEVQKAIDRLGMRRMELQRSIQDLVFPGRI
jgi:hypothetical protein